MDKNKKTTTSSKSVRVTAGTIIAGSIVGIATGNTPANAALQFETLGTGGQIRSTLLDNIATSDSVSPYSADHKEEGKDKKPVPTPTPDEKSGEGKCGEGKCGGSK